MLLLCCVLLNRKVYKYRSIYYTMIKTTHSFYCCSLSCCNKMNRRKLFQYHEHVQFAQRLGLNKIAKWLRTKRTHEDSLGEWRTYT